MFPKFITAALLQFYSYTDDMSYKFEMGMSFEWPYFSTYIDSKKNLLIKLNS